MFFVALIFCLCGVILVSMTDLATATRELVSVLTHCYRVGIRRVIFKRGGFDHYESVDRYITINSNRTIQNQVYILLHEYGHHHIIQDGALGRKFAVLVDRVANNTVSEQILAIEEEVLAWHFGEELAKTLGVSTDNKRYQVLKATCLKSHIGSYHRIAATKG